MNRRYRIIVMMLALLFLFSSCTGKGDDRNVIDIDPEEQALNYDDNNAVLYYVNEDYSMLIGVEKEIEIPVSSNIEYAVVEALIAGYPNGRDAIRSIVNPATKILSITRNGNSITVILSKEFLDWSFIPDTYLDSGNTDIIKQLTVYSVVNSLVETALCHNVQILVDKNGNGSGQRIRLNEVGMGGNGVLGQLTRQNSYILTSEKVLEEIFNSLANRDYISLYDNVAAIGTDGSERPVLNSFVTSMQSMDVSLEYFNLEERTDQSSQEHKIIMCDYVIVDSDGERVEYKNIPVKLIRENGLWKISYDMLQKMFG